MYLKKEKKENDMKKLFAFLLIFSVMLLSSCSEIEIIELNERLIIEAIGIDFEDGKYKVTIEGLDSFTSGSEGNNISPGRLTKCYLFEGETIGMAMNSISEITGQTPLFSQARVLVIGMDTAKHRMSEALDFFRREYTTRTDILIAVSENKASETVSADFGENVSAGSVTEAALESYRHTGKCTHTPLYKFLNSMMGETDSAFCPLIGTKDNTFTEKKEVDIKGTVIFGKNGKTVILTKEETLALMLINNNVENGDFTVKTDKGTFTFEIIKNRTRFSVKTENGRVLADIDISMRCDIPEYQTENLSGLSKQDTENAAYTASRKTAELICSVIEKTLYKNGCDVFELGRKINLKDHEYYSSRISGNGSFSDSISFNINVGTSVRRIGKVTLEKNQ